MSDGEDGGIVLALWHLVGELYAIFVASNVGVGPWVEKGDTRVVLLEMVYDVDDFGIADVGTVFFERET